MEVEALSEAEKELDGLPASERKAMLNALEKLQQMGLLLGAPHSSQVKGSSLRELRPRQGRSPWRALYRRSGDLLVVGAIGPEAGKDRRGFARAVTAAENRISAFAEG
ncbi:MAG TPA: type II toxin-antitoxin system RelE/ParE family toxin [Candidatus Micrarchaeaceae archaeon]|nr:type II toxin-antitoxin system RelE/ParE family toxin [Candidatus Micrarchaeaceae archaeon]